LTVSLIFLALVPATLAFTRNDYHSFKINLDLKPHERFVEMATVLKTEVNTAMDDFLKLVPKFFVTVFDKAAPLLKILNREFFEEVEGISDTLGRPLAEVLLLNYFYDFTAFCTSIVARTPEGSIIHGRNQDYAFPDTMRRITFVAQFEKGGQPLFEAIMFGGSIGIYTGIKHGAFSVSFNARNTDHITIDNWISNAMLIFEGGIDLSWHVRQALTTCANFECAYAALLSKVAIAPGYMIIAGTEKYEGAVISRDRDGPAHVAQLSEDVWYIS